MTTRWLSLRFVEFSILQRFSPSGHPQQITGFTPGFELTEHNERTLRARTDKPRSSFVKLPDRADSTRRNGPGGIWSYSPVAMVTQTLHVGPRWQHGPSPQAERLTTLPAPAPLNALLLPQLSGWPAFLFPPSFSLASYGSIVVLVNLFLSFLFFSINKCLQNRKKRTSGAKSKPRALMKRETCICAFSVCHLRYHDETSRQE